MTQGANGPTDIHMAATGCASEPTFSQQINATQYVQNTTEAAAATPPPPRRWRQGTLRCHRRPTPSCTT